MKKKEYYVEVFKTGFLKENFYCFIKGSNCLLIDPGEKNIKLENFIKENKLKVLAILITHYHFDHTNALEYYKNKYNVGVIDYKTEHLNNIENFNFEIINTFGHTKDSVTFYFKDEQMMFTGDFLFKETIGNYEMENENLMINSLKEIKKYNKDIIIYPGHEEMSTLKHEMNNNQYLLEVQ